jgi:chromatin structure-remodeling complex subunit RSC9
MYVHILKDHFGAPQREDGKFDNTQGKEFTCAWDKCHRFKTAPATKLSEIATHIKIHLAPRPSSLPKDSADHFGPPPAKKIKPSYIVAPPKQAFKYHFTPVDENGDAAGIPLSAVLVLRNLARNLSKTEAEEITTKLDGGVSWVERLFKPVEPRLYEVTAHNKSLVCSIPISQ